MALRIAARLLRRAAMSASQLGQLLRAPLFGLARAYNNAAVKRPFVTGIITTTLKTSAADLFAQKVIEGREEVDWRRHSVFCVFGFAYLGGFQYYLYNNLFQKLCAPLTRTFGHIGSSPIKTFIDQCIHHPLLYFPTFYLMKGFVEDRPPLESMKLYQKDMWENLKALWTIWVPAQLVNFAFVPLHLRIPYVAGVSFAWTVIISVMRGALDTSHTQVAQAPAESEDTSIVSHSSVLSGTAALSVQPQSL